MSVSGSLFELLKRLQKIKIAPWKPHGCLFLLDFSNPLKKSAQPGSMSASLFPRIRKLRRLQKGNKGKICFSVSVQSLRKDPNSHSRSDDVCLCSKFLYTLCIRFCLGLSKSGSSSACLSISFSKAPKASKTHWLLRDVCQFLSKVSNMSK